MKDLMKQISQTKDAEEQNRLLEKFMEAKEVEKQISMELGTVVK
jgi:hypothetical protein